MTTRTAAASPMSRFAFPAAVAGAGFIVLLTVLGGFGFPGYSHLAHFISELGARGAPHEMLVRFVGFLPAGLLLCFFAWVAARALPASRLASVGFVGIAVYAAGYAVAAFFPCDAGCRPASPSPSQVVHNIGGLAGYAMAPVAMLCLGLAARRWPSGRGLSATAFVVAVAVAALLGLLSLSPKSPWVGASQRLIEAAMLSWIVLCGAYIRARLHAAAGAGATPGSTPGR